MQRRLLRWMVTFTSWPSNSDKVCTAMIKIKQYGHSTYCIILWKCVIALGGKGKGRQRDGNREQEKEKYKNHSAQSHTALLNSIELYSTILNYSLHTTTLNSILLYSTPHYTLLNSTHYSILFNSTLLNITNLYSTVLHCTHLNSILFSTTFHSPHFPT